MPNQVMNDFATLFSYCWYRDFPVDGYSRDMGSVSDWNIHTGYTVRRVADLMGYFVHFESSNRTDAVIRDTEKMPVAFLEWEWQSPKENAINEISKLRHAADLHQPKFCFLFGYAPAGTIQSQLSYIAHQWGADTPIEAARPLLVSLIEYEGAGTRIFKSMSMYCLDNSDDTWRLLRQQQALASNVLGTRWA